MRLHSSYTSPYVRKVKVFLRETGLMDAVTETYTNPSDERVLRPLNPIGKIPALEVGDGEVLYDSRVICAYLDSCHGAYRRIPEDGQARWQVLRAEALADGLADAANLRRNEAMRAPSSLISDDFLARQDLAIKHCLLALDALAENWLRSDFVLHDQIAAAGAVGYIAFRYDDLPWRAHCPALADWFATFSARDSMVMSEPRNPPGRPAPPPQTVAPRWPS